MPNDRKLIALTAILLAIASLLPSVSRAEEPAHPKAADYPAVQDVPARPEKPAMTADEQLKLKQELTAARDRQAPMGKTTVGTGSGKPVKP
jgi:hypothetical protein